SSCFSLHCQRRPRRSALSPAPPLSRSAPSSGRPRRRRRARVVVIVVMTALVGLGLAALIPRRDRAPRDKGTPAGRGRGARVAPGSEEHTSGLQSLTNIVCRLLLAKPTE